MYDLKNFGIHGPEEVSAVGANAKMNEFCAAMGICNLRHLSEEIAKREKVYNRYLENLEGIDGIKTNYKQPGLKRNYANFPILINEKQYGTSRAEVFESLFKHNVFTRKYFYPLTSAFTAFHGKYDPTTTPVALYVSKRIISLPMYADLSLENVEL